MNYIRSFRVTILISDSSDLNHSSKFLILVVVAFTKKEKRHISKKKKKNKAASRANTQPVLVIVRESYLFYDSCMRYGKSKLTTSYVLLNMNMSRGYMILK